MLGTEVTIHITRKTDEVDTKDEYIDIPIYSDLVCRMIEIKAQEFSTDISQAQAEQCFAFMIPKDKTAVKIGDNIFYTDTFGDVNLKIITRPKLIEFEGDESFIKLTAKLVGS